MSTRTERDSLGYVDVPDERLWGAQTQRSLESFRISTERMPLALVHALVLVKKAVALVNRDLGVLEEKKAQAIVAAADEVIAGRLDEHFPLVVWQTGSGTQTNMNVNEVIANRAIEMAGGPRGEDARPPERRRQPVAVLATTPSRLRCIAAVGEGVRDGSSPRWPLRDDLDGEGEGVRRDRQDRADAPSGRRPADARAGDLGLGLAARPRHRAHRPRRCPHLSELALGGTAVGTGLNAHSGLRRPAVAAKIAELTGHPFVAAPNKFEALAAHDALVVACRRAQDARRRRSRRSRTTSAGSPPGRAAASARSDPGERARELDHARQGEPDAVRGDDDGLRAGHGQRRRRQHRREPAATSS